MISVISELYLGLPHLGCHYYWTSTHWSCLQAHHVMYLKCIISVLQSMWVKVHIKLMVIYYAWSQGNG